MGAHSGTSADDRILVVGADGTIGRELAASLTLAGGNVLKTTRRRETIRRSGAGEKSALLLDLEADPSLWNLPPRVSSAFLCAAISGLDQCERDPEQTAQVNVHHTVLLAERLVGAGSFVVFPSTSQVFDGSTPFRKSSAPTCPRTEYGRQKAEAERRLLALGDSVSVVRLTKVIAPDTPLFRGWVERLRSGQAIHPYRNMVMAGIPLSFAVAVLRQVSERRLSGIIQVSAGRDIAYERVAHRFCHLLGADPELIQPVLAEGPALLPGAQPLNTTLDTSRLRELGLEVPADWSAVDSVLAS